MQNFWMGKCKCMQLELPCLSQCCQAQTFESLHTKHFRFVCIRSTSTQCCGCVRPGEMSSQELADIRRRIRQVQKAVRRQDACGDVPDHIVRRAILVYIWSVYSMPAAVSYLQAKAFPNQTKEEVEVCFQRIFLATPSHVLTRLSIDPKVLELTDACKWIVHRELHRFVLEQNILHSVAPTRLQLMWEGLRVIPEGVPLKCFSRLSAPFISQPSSQRRHLRKFRKQWKLRIGQLRLLPLDPLHRLQEKAT